MMCEDFSMYNGDGTQLRKAQLVMLEILKQVDLVCKKHKIDYLLDGGTCLGAVRHGGFIPWDDDIDINVKRSDMKRLRKALQSELPDNLYFQDKSTDKHYCWEFAKVRDRNTIFQEEGNDREEHQGIFIDIIPVEPFFSLKSKKMIDYFYARCCRGIRHFYTYKKKDIVIAYLLWLPFRTIVAVYRLMVRIFKPKMWGHVFGWESYNCVEEKYMFPVKNMLFEGVEVLGPNNPDAFLSALFGDYMRIPPKEERVTHAMKIVFLNE